MFKKLKIISLLLMILSLVVYVSCSITDENKSKDNDVALKEAVNLEIIDVTNFGGRPEDQNDDSSAIELALQQCESQGGGIVYLRSPDSIGYNRWLLTHNIVIPNNCYLKGDGVGATVMEIRDEKITISVPNEYSGIKDMTIIAEKPSYRNTVITMDLTSEYREISNVEIRDFGEGIGIDVIAKDTSIFISQVNFDNVGTGIKVESTKYVYLYINQSNFYNFTGYAIYSQPNVISYPYPCIVVSNSNIYNFWGYALYVNKTSKINLTDVKINNLFGNIDNSNFSVVYVNNITEFNCSNVDIYNLTFDHKDINTYKYSAIHLEGDIENMSFVNCDITDMNCNGIYIDKSLPTGIREVLQVKGCSFRNLYSQTGISEKRVGIWLVTLLPNNSFRNILIEDNSFRDIVGNYPDVIDNMLSKISSCGVSIYERNLSAINIANNIIFNSNLFKDINDSTTTGGVGIHLSKIITSFVITSNIFEGLHYGIWILANDLGGSDIPNNQDVFTIDNNNFVNMSIGTTIDPTIGFYGFYIYDTTGWNSSGCGQNNINNWCIGNDNVFGN